MSVCTSTIRIRRCSIPDINRTRVPMSYTSCRHSRNASRTIGKSECLRATSSSWAARCRCCHSGDRRPGVRRGSSRARAAHSRNRAANNADPPTSRVTIDSISVASKTKRSAPGGLSSVSGRRTTMPSSVAVGDSLTP
ncbi:Uncharacterised protein [Mycobacteroides abscessus subsp. abscessus]|nr:Uncharacterised protein [Mycobacteroides abscessus subsp. abscessus]